MIIIQTKYLGPTNYRPSRVRASTMDNKPSTGKPDRLTMSYDSNLESVQAHRKAALALAEREGWDGEWQFVGDYPCGYLWARIPNRPADNFTVEAMANVEEA